MPTYTRSTPGVYSGSRVVDEQVLGHPAPSVPAATPDLYDTHIRPALKGLRSAADYVAGDPTDPTTQLMHLIAPGSGMLGGLFRRGTGRLAKSAGVNAERLMKDLAVNSGLLFGRAVIDQQTGRK